MNPLPDRTVIVVIVATIGLCFALVFWTVRLQPAAPPLQWRDNSATTLNARPMAGPASTTVAL